MGDLKAVVDLKIRIEHNEHPSINEYDKLMNECISYMEHMASDEYCEDRQSDYSHAVFEVAMMLVYGEKAFDEVNRLSDEQDKLYSARDVEDRKQQLRDELAELEGDDG